MSDIKNRSGMKAVRHARLRRKLSGTAERPRLVVFRSNKHIYAQLVDDTNSQTLTGVSSLTPEIRKANEKAKGMELAKAVGTAIADRAKQRKVESVVFDRGGAPYTGAIKALADSARAGGLHF